MGTDFHTLRGKKGCNNCRHAHHISVVLQLQPLLTAVYLHDNKSQNSKADIPAVTDIIQTYSLLKCA